MNQQTLLSPSSNDSQQQIKGYANRKEIVRWLLQTPQEIRFKLIPSFNRFQRPDDFIFTVANPATAMMMGRSLENLIGHKLIEVLNIHPFHHFYQNYLRTYLYQTTLIQNIEMPILSRKNKHIVHEAEVIEGALVVTISVASKEVVTPPVIETIKSKSSENQPIAEVVQPCSETMPLETTNLSSVITSEKDLVENPLAPTIEIPETEQNLQETIAEVEEVSTTLASVDEEAATTTVGNLIPTENTSEKEQPTNIDLLASQQISVNGKIEYVNEDICDTLELAEYNHQEVFIQDILHKVSQLPYHFALLQAKAQQVVRNLPLIFVTKSKKYVKVKGRIEPQTQDGQVTGLKLYYQVLQHTADFHQVAAFGKLPAFNSF